MIITKQKSKEDILEYLKDCKKVFLMGCSLCATVCKTGGEKELDKMKEVLEADGKVVTGSAVLDPACNLLEIKRFYRKNSKEIDSSNAILSLACGGGTQAIGEIIDGKKVVPANDTLFQGEITKMSIKTAMFEQKCSLCGDCVLAITGAICPVTRCPKGLLNGPCGGVKNKKCEINSEMDCVWIKIYEKLKQFGQVNWLRKKRIPKDNRNNKKPQNLIIE